MSTGEQKSLIRQQALGSRRAQQNKSALSRRIVSYFMALPEYHRAAAVMFYVHARSEVRTREALQQGLDSEKRVVIPYCVGGQLELFHLEQLSELEVGMHSILEPKEQLRRVDQKRVSVEQLDLIMVPGVAFDRRGARMGHGHGYYDKLLERAHPETPLVALAYECQMVPEIPTEEHDIFMDWVITEQAVYAGRGRR